MKKLLVAILTIICVNVQAQTSYQYYFIEMRPTGKGEVEVAPELGVTYTDIDSLLVAGRETKKNGAVIVTGKKYDSYSALFNRLSREGLEFVQMAGLSSFGGAAAMLATDLKVNYLIWRKRTN